MPHCYKCGEDKSPEMFHNDASRTSGKASKCKLCMREYVRTSRNQKTKRREQVRRKRHANAVVVRNGKSSCAICGYNKCKEALDYHHTKEKLFVLSKQTNWNVGRVKKEMDKCIVVCANCHREIHNGIHKGIDIATPAPAALPLLVSMGID